MEIIKYIWPVTKNGYTPDMSLIGLNPERCIRCGSKIHPKYREDICFFEGNEYIIQPGIWCIECTGDYGSPEFRMTMCSRCECPIIPDPYAIGSILPKFPIFGDKVLCHSCFWDTEREQFPEVK